MINDKTFSPEILDIDKFIKVNGLKEITNPVFFTKDNIPSSDGLLSNEIFGITKEERSNTFAYINLSEYFFHPLFYKVWGKLDKKVKECVHGAKKFIITEKGELEESEDGESGVKFIKKNIDKIKIKRSDSSKRDRDIEFLRNNKDKMFISKQIIMPAYYRDVNTNNGFTGVGEINSLYNSLLIAVRSLKDSKEYGINLSDMTRGRIQEIILQIYSWYGMGAEINGNKTTNVIPGKTGILKRSILYKTTDYSSRLVISAPNLIEENVDDLQVDLEYSLLPLASAIVNFFPFVVFNVRRFFENEFAGKSHYTYINKQGQLDSVKIKDYLMEFSDERIKKELDRYIHGYSNRFIPILVPNEEGKQIRMRFKGRMTAKDYNEKNVGTSQLLNRDLTWCDIFFMAAVESVKDKHVLITRYPMDSYFNQFPTKVKVSSTKETEPIFYDTTFYPNYPKIRQEDIGTNTSNSFIDTLNICNAFLNAIGGDYDGDQTTVKGVYSNEANEELDNFMDSKSFYISLGGENVRTLTNEGIQSLYCLTMNLRQDEGKFSDPEF